jgi:catalase
VHARGSGAFGKFTLFESASDVTSAGVLTDTSRETPVFTRFSTVLGSRGSADTVRDVRGFAVKYDIPASAACAAFAYILQVLH